jgi:hypothetical protein
MGVLMVRKEMNRRSSLLMGIALAILIGAAAAFLVLALPQHVLEKVTTISGLSHVMVQAEPPISQDDRGLLAVLAGIGTAGLGWVAIDWLLFARVGMSAIIRQREDDYEEEGEGYRPVDPLDLIKHVPRTITEVGPSANPNDPRRPLSARTDIGDPPKPAAWPPAPFDIAVDQFLPPIDRLLPDVERPASSGPAIPPITGVTPDALNLALPVLPVAPRAAAPSRPASQLADLPGWVPPPQPSPQPSQAAPIIPQPITDVAPSEGSGIRSAPPPPRELASDQRFATFPPPELMPAPVVAPLAVPPVFQQAQPSPVSSAMPVASQSVAMPRERLDSAPLGDLLTRLEQGMRRRRPTTPPPVREIQTQLAAFEAPQHVPPTLPAAPSPQVVAPSPPPPSFAAPLVPHPVPAEPASWQPQAQSPATQHAAPSSAYVAAPVAPILQPESSAPLDGDGLLDQPLHVALGVLRNLVRR